MAHEDSPASTAAAPAALLAAQDVSRHFRAGTRHEVRAVDRVSLAVAPGSFTALSGASGSGKTTLLALLGALERPSGGNILFQGRDLGRASDVELARTRRRMGFVFQNFSLLPRLPAWENVSYPLVPRGVSRAQRHAIARELLSGLDLADKLQSPPEELSGGEQQRVAVARALAGRPEVLLADEPTSNLDRRNARELIAIFRDLHASGLTLVVATHDPEMLALATQTFELDHGRLVGQGGTGLFAIDTVAPSK